MQSSTGIARRFTSGELFCGAGGLSSGFHAHGFDTRFANDIWPLALHNFMMNFDPLYAASGGIKGDLVSLSGSVEDIHVGDLQRLVEEKGGGRLARGDLDVLLGGPPCQGFSLNSHTRSGEDPRNFLFRHYVRILQGLAPKVFVLENVPGMYSLEGGRFFDELIATIGEPSEGCPGYEVAFKIVNAAHYGVPQDRFRVVLVGTRRDVANVAGKVELPVPRHYSLSQAHFKGGRAHTFHHAIGFRKRLTQKDVPQIGPQLTEPVTVAEAIDDLPALGNGGGADVASYTKAKAPMSDYQRWSRSGASVLGNHWCRALAQPNIERAKHIPAGGDWRSIPHELLPPGMQRAARKDHTKRYGRLRPDELSGTLLTKPDPHWGTFLHYDIAQQRLISVREAARIQSFPDSYQFHGGQVDQYRLCGNAVPPLMAAAVAEQVTAVLDLYYASTHQNDTDLSTLVRA